MFSKPQIPFPSNPGQKIVNHPPGFQGHNNRRPGKRPINRPGGGGAYPDKEEEDEEYLEPLVTIDLCYFLGDDVLDSHVPYFEWFEDSEEGYKNYVNLLTLRATKIMSKVRLGKMSWLFALILF